MLKAVIFDVDGTLIDSVDLHARSWIEAFARFGVNATFDEVRGHIGEGADRLIPMFVPTGTPRDKIKQIEDFRADLFKRKYLAEVKPLPKVQELFGLIKAAGCKLVLASSCAADEIDEYKAIAGITDMTDHDVTSDDAGSSKPAPDIFVKALDLLVPVRPTETCVVGDTKYDGEAARRAGIPFIGVLSGGSTRGRWKAQGRSRSTAIQPICSHTGAFGETCLPGEISPLHTPTCNLLRASRHGGRTTKSCAASVMVKDLMAFLAKRSI